MPIVWLYLREKLVTAPLSGLRRPRPWLLQHVISAPRSAQPGSLALRPSICRVRMRQRAKTWGGSHASGIHRDRQYRKTHGRADYQGRTYTGCPRLETGRGHVPGRGGSGLGRVAGRGRDPHAMWSARACPGPRRWSRSYSAKMELRRVSCQGPSISITPPTLRLSSGGSVTCWLRRAWTRSTPLSAGVWRAPAPETWSCSSEAMRQSLKRSDRSSTRWRRP